MPKSISTAELRKMQIADLLKEIGEKRTLIAKITMGVHLRTEKDTAKLKHERRGMARLLTILAELQGAEQLKSKPKTSKMPAPATTSA